MRILKYTLVCLLSFTYYAGNAQVTGGDFAFQYLTMSNSAHVSALGGISVANPDNDIALALQNPAMMRPGMHNELELTYNDYYAPHGRNEPGLWLLCTQAEHRFLLWDAIPELWRYAADRPDRQCKRHLSCR